MKTKSGMTLMEVLAVIAIITLLAAIVSVVFSGYRNRTVDQNLFPRTEIVKILSGGMEFRFTEQGGHKFAIIETFHGVSICEVTDASLVKTNAEEK